MTRQTHEQTRLPPIRPALRTLDHTRITIAAQALGVAQGALDYALGYVRERRQFGRAIADFQGLQFMIADMAMKLEAARQLTYAAARSDRAMAGEHVADLTFFSSACKCLASDVAMSVTTDAVQLLGGYGYVNDYPVERTMRDAKITQVAAQSLAQRRKEVIGLVAVENRGPETDIEREGFLFIEEVLRGVERALGELGWSVLISFLRAADLAGAYQRMQKISAKVDGMLIAEGIIGSEQLALLAARVPIVLIAADPDELHADVIGADNRSGTKAAVCHMIEQHGRTRLFYIAGPSEAPDARERRSAFEEAVAEHPEATMAGSFEGRFAAISGQLAVREILTGPRREVPDAIVCGNDQMAIGAMRELQAAGIRVPADVAVVGFDDMHLSGLLGRR